MHHLCLHFTCYEVQFVKGDSANRGHDSEMHMYSYCFFKTEFTISTALKPLSHKGLLGVEDIETGTIAILTMSACHDSRGIRAWMSKLSPITTLSNTGALTVSCKVVRIVWLINVNDKRWHLYWLQLSDYVFKIACK